MEKEKPEKFDPYATPPKLTLISISSFSKRAQAQDRPGMATPPIRLSGVIPFEWEEAPGRPKQQPNQVQTGSAPAAGGAGADADRQLGLPPRLAASASSTEQGRGGRSKTVSSTTVLDRHYFLIRKRPVFVSVGRHRLLLFSRKDQKEMKMRWDAGLERSSVDMPSNTSGSSSSSSSSLKSLSSVSVCSYWSDGEEEISKEEAKVDDQSKEEKRKVKILRYKRKRSLTCVAAYSASHFWV